MKIRGAILRWTDPGGEEGTVTLNSVFRANNGEMLRELAARGHGVVCVPKFILQPKIVSGDLVEIFPGYTWADSNLYVLYPPTAHMPIRLRALIDYLADRFKD